MKTIYIIIGFLSYCSLCAQTLSSDDGWDGFGKKWYNFNLNNLPITSNDLDGHECFFKLPGEDMRTDDLYMPYLNYFGTKGNVKKINIYRNQIFLNIFKLKRVKQWLSDVAVSYLIIIYSERDRIRVFSS